MQVIANGEVIYEFGSFVLDPNEKTLLVEGIPVRLPAKEFDTLVLLIENNGRALSKEEMLSAIWSDSFVEETNIAKNISRLRKVLETNGSKYIETIPKHGYRFTADVKRVGKARDESLIIERQTVKRLTVSLADRVEPATLALLPAAGLRRRWPIIALLAIVILGVGFSAWRFGSIESQAADPYEPLRLTESPHDDTGPTWTRDGRIRFFRIYPDNRSVPMIMNADGSSQSEIRTADDKRIFSWSPDERKIVFDRHGDATRTYLANVDGTDEVLLPFRGGNWSADSKMITYRALVAGGNHDIFVYFLETGEVRNVTNHESFDADPSFSPDGKRIVFGSGRDGNGEIYSIDVDGSNLRRLTFHPAADAHAAYSPDGTQILFTSDRENENTDVYVMSADGSGTPVKITRMDKSNETAGAGGWSPDGTQIAFFSDRNGKDDIYVVSAESIRPETVYSDADHDIGSFSVSPDESRLAFSRELEDRSGELLVLRNGRTAFLRKTELTNVGPAWSPDGNKLVFYDRVNGNSEVLLVDPDGSGLENLTNDPSRDTAPAWSPDGRSLVFLTYRGVSPQTPQLYTMNADGSDPRPLKAAKGWDAEPTWSPDGDLVFFTCDREEVLGNLMDICQIRADGTGEKVVLPHRDPDGQPAVSPDGRRIAFVSWSDGNAEIYLMNVDGSQLVRLTRHPGEDKSPAWSRDGQRLYFISNRSGRSAIYEAKMP